MHRSNVLRSPGRRRRAALALAAVVASGIGLAACGSASAASPAPDPSTGSAATGSSTALAVRTTSLGTILTDGRGFTVYAFEADKGTTSACSGACATAWPPVITTGTAAKVASGVTQSLVGQTTRPGGARQLTYAGHPLYFYAGDSAPGNITGQGSRGFGARWDVLTASGQEVTTGG